MAGEKGPGRPRVVPGEPSVEVSVTLERSLVIRLRDVAQVERIEGGMHEAIRIACRSYVRNILHGSGA